MINYNNTFHKIPCEIKIITIISGLKKENFFFGWCFLHKCGQKLI